MALFSKKKQSEELSLPDTIKAIKQAALVSITANPFKNLYEVNNRGKSFIISKKENDIIISFLYNGKEQRINFTI